MARSILLHVALLSIFLHCVQVVEAQRPRRPQGRPLRAPDKLQEGDTAPDFTLKQMDGKEAVTLSSFQGERPVALIFGSYT